MEAPTIGQMQKDFGPEELNKLYSDKILHILELYPIISPSMLQIGLGTSVAPRIWRPILLRLIAEGKVQDISIQAARVGDNAIQTYRRLTLHKPTPEQTTPV